MLIILTKGKMMEVDDEDFQFMSQFSWYAQKDRNASRQESSYQARTEDKRTKRKLLAHRLLLGVTDPEVEVDHIDGHTLNNRRSNLRICSGSQNKQNQKVSCGAVPYKGVSLIRNAKERPYRAQIYMHGPKKISLGCYATPEEAARAYNAAALKYFGEFACLNVIPEEGG